MTARIAAVGAIAAGALALCGTADAATPAPGQALNTTHGFHVYNYTHEKLTLSSATGFDGAGPTIGTVLWPGESEDLEVAVRVGDQQLGTADYTNEDGQTFEARFGTEFAYDDTINDSVPQGYTASRDWTSDNEGLFFDDGGGTLDLDGTDNSVGPLVQHLCSDGVATCTFDHDVTARFYAPGRVIASGNNQDTNKGDKPYPLLTVGTNDTADSSDTIGVEVNAGGSIAGIIDVGIKGSFAHTWGQSHTFQSSFAVPIPPGMHREILAADAMVKDTGDLTMTLNNITWHVMDATFISPDSTTASDYTASAPTPITAN
ncbi:hypothetical protein [Nakamurella endophytica]|nr:hypothetical protein [Nakamurella endophytica]